MLSRIVLAFLHFPQPFKLLIFLDFLRVIMAKGVMLGCKV